MKKIETIGIYGLKLLIRHDIDFDSVRYSPKEGKFYFGGLIPEGLEKRLREIGFNYPFEMEKKTINQLTK